MRPENMPQTVEVLSQTTEKTPAGRVRDHLGIPTGQVQCILSIAKPDEVERFSQPEAKVTHTIFQSGGTIRAKQGEYMRLKKNGRLFRVLNYHNHGEQDIFTTYYCEERSDRA